MTVKTAKENKLETQPGGCGFSETLLDQMGFLMGRASQKLQELQARDLGPMGLLGKHLGILQSLQDKGLICQQEIGKLVHIDRTTMVDMIDHLEKLGLVERREHPTDRRSHSVALTEKGRKTLQKARHLAQGVQEKFLSVLSAEEQKKLLQLMKKLVMTHYTHAVAGKEKIS